MSLCAMNRSFLGPTRILKRLDWNCLVIVTSVGDHYKWSGYRNSTCPWRGFKYSDVPDDETEEMSREAVSEIDNPLIGGVEVSGGSSSGMSCKQSGSNASGAEVSGGSSSGMSCKQSGSNASGAEVSDGSSSGMSCKHAGSNASSTASREDTAGSSSDGPAATVDFDDSQPGSRDSQSMSLLLRCFPFFFFDEKPKNDWLAAPGS